MTVRREYIGITRGLASYQRAYRIPDGIEIEHMEGYEVHRRRVFFDDVMLVTYHRALGAFYLTTIGLVALVVASVALILGIEISPTAALYTLPFLMPLVGAILIRLALKVDVITVWGRRSRAEIRFAFRKKRARRVYRELIAAIRSSQRRLSAAGAIEVPPPDAATEPAPPPPGDVEPPAS